MRHRCRSKPGAGLSPARRSAEAGMGFARRVRKTRRGPRLLYFCQRLMPRGDAHRRGTARSRGDEVVDHGKREEESRRNAKFPGDQGAYGHAQGAALRVVCVMQTAGARASRLRPGMHIRADRADAHAKTLQCCLALFLPILCWAVTVCPHPGADSLECRRPVLSPLRQQSRPD